MLGRADFEGDSTPVLDNTGRVETRGERDVNTERLVSGDIEGDRDTFGDDESDGDGVSLTLGSDEAVTGIDGDEHGLMLAAKETCAELLAEEVGAADVVPSRLGDENVVLDAVDSRLALRNGLALTLGDGDGERDCDAGSETLALEVTETREVADRLAATDSVDEPQMVAVNEL